MNRKNIYQPAKRTWDLTKPGITQTKKNTRDFEAENGNSHSHVEAETQRGLEPGL